MRIDGSLVYLAYPVDRINTQVIYQVIVLDNFVTKHDVTVTLGLQDSSHYQHIVPFCWIYVNSVEQDQTLQHLIRVYIVCFSH